MTKQAIKQIREEGDEQILKCQRREKPAKDYSTFMSEWGWICFHGDASLHLQTHGSFPRKLTETKNKWVLTPPMCDDAMSTNMLLLAVTQA